MNVWKRLVVERWLRPRVIVLRQKELNEAELNEALGVLPTHPMLVAINQILDTGERNAWQDAATSANQPNVATGFVYRAEAFRQLRDDLEIRRLRGRGGESD